MRTVLALFLATAVVLAVGCSKRSPEGTSPQSAPTGIEWQLVSIGGTPAGTGGNGQAATLLLDETSGRASGYAGCNTFSGSYLLSGELPHIRAAGDDPDGLRQGRRARVPLHDGA